MSLNTETHSHIHTSHLVSRSYVLAYIVSPTNAQKAQFMYHYTLSFTPFCISILLTHITPPLVVMIFEVISRLPHYLALVVIAPVLSAIIFDITLYAYRQASTWYLLKKTRQLKQQE